MKHFVLLVGLLLSNVLLYAQAVSFTAVVDARSVTLDGYFEVKFTVENGRGKNFRAPAFKDFEVLSGPSTSVSTSIINGEYSTSAAYTYLLRPKKVGLLTVGAAKVTVDGKAYRTKPISVEVVKGKAKSDAAIDDMDIQVKAITPTATSHVYVGQQVPLDYKIYTTKNINSYNILRESEYQGFFAEDVRRINFGTVREVIDGIQYTTQVLKRIALFPQQTGVLTIDPMQMQIGIAQGRLRDPRDFFYTPTIKAYNLASNELELEVRPLPEGAPSSFTGAVGSYSMQARVVGQSITTDEALTIQITITGDGDVKRVQPPIVDLGSNFEVYAPKVLEERTGERNGKIIGIKSYEYIAIPMTTGKNEFQLEFSYFRPDSNAYEIIRSEVFPVIVRQGTGKKNTTSLPQQNTGSQDILPIVLETKLKKKSTSFTGSPLFWGLLGLPLISIFGTFLFVQRKRKLDTADPYLLKGKKANKVAKMHLAEADKHRVAENSRAFYDEISKAMLGYVNDKLKIPNSELTKHNVKERLEQLQVNEGLTSRFLSLLKTCEMALFARKDGASDMEAVYKEAVEVIVKIEQIVKN